jgi:hypothetical protein
VNNLKTWLIDVGLWYAKDLRDWSWNPRRFRLMFWRTPTNATHRTYRNLVADLVLSQAVEYKKVYEQGLRDGALQYSEILAEEGFDEAPEVHYPH